MNRSLIGHTKFNALTSYIYFSLNALITFFISPVLISLLGVNTFGIWKTIQKYLDFATVADGRPSQALKWVIANKASSGDVDEKMTSVGSALRTCLFYLPVLILVVLILVYFLPSVINDLDNGKIYYVRYVGFIIGINIILAPFLTIPDSILVGENQGYRATLLRSFWLIVSNITILYFAYSGHSILTLSIVLVGTAILNGISTYFLATKYISWLGVKRPNKEQFKMFFGFSSWVLIWSFIAKTLLASELLLLSFLVGSGLVTSYVFSTYVTQLGLALALMSGSALTPSIGRLLGESKYDTAVPIITGFREINMLFAVVIGGCVLLLNKSFVTLWVGSEFYLGEWIHLLIVICFMQLLLLRCESQVLDLSLDIKNKVLIGLLSTVLSISLSMIFYKISNGEITAIFFGIIVGRLIMSIMFPKLVNNYLGIKKYRFINYFYSGLFLVLCFYISQYIEINNWLEFLVVAIFLCLILVYIAYTLILSDSGKKLISSLK